MRKLGNFSVRTIDYTFIGLLMIILMSTIVGFSEWISDGWMKYLVFLFSLVLVVLFAIFGGRILQRLCVASKWIDRFSALKLGLILFFIVLITKVFFVFLFNNDADKTIDMHLYKSFATQLANSGEITENIEPALHYPYQVIYGLFLSPVVKLFGNDSRVLASFLSLLFSIATVILYDILRKYVGKNKAFLGLLLFNLLPVGLFETQLLIHETPLLFLYILSFWLLNVFLNNGIKPWKRIIALVLSAIIIGFGNKINQGGTVVIISYCIYVFIIISREKLSLKAIFKVCSSVLCYAICFVVISNICASFVETHVVVPESEKTIIEKVVGYDVSLGWPLFLGSNIEQSGHWNAEDAETYDKYKEFDNKEDAQDYLKGLVNERLQVIKNNPLLIPGHLFNKIKGLWGDPFLPFTYEEGNQVNEFVLYGFHGIIYKALLAISYWVFILLCSLILFSYNRHKIIKIDTFYTPISQFKMMIMGLTLVLFLFEVMPKYVSHMHIIMFSIGIFSIDRFMDNSQRIHSRLIPRERDNRYDIR